MENARTIDSVIIVIAAILAIVLIIAIIITAISGINPFVLMSGNTEMLNDIVESSSARNTNILAALSAEGSPTLYPVGLLGTDSYRYRDANEREPIFKTCNTYELMIEAYNKPANSNAGTEVYGPFGIEFSIPEVKLNEAQKSAVDSATEALIGSILIPYHAESYSDGSYISCVDLASSAITVEKHVNGVYEPVASVTDTTWSVIMENNGGIAVLREPDGTLIYGEGEYRVSIYLCQMLISGKDGNMSYELQKPECDLYTLHVNRHECANGVLIPSGDTVSYDIQLNVINDDTAVSYSTGSKITVGGELKLGISLSEDRHELTSNVFTSLGARGTLEIYLYDYSAQDYVLVDECEFLKGCESYYNTSLTLGGESYVNGKYKIVMNYDSFLEHISEEYEYYFVFER